MIQNYLKIAWRNLLKLKGFSFINILGLAIGITACLIIFLYVHNELTFDQYNTKISRIARATVLIHGPESDVAMASSPVLLADALKRDYPEVESAVRLEQDPQVIKYRGDLIKETGFYKADQTIFSIFSFEFKEGNPSSALQNPKSLVLTESTEKKYFGETPALGKTMNCDGEYWLVTAVVRDRPVNSDIQIDALMSSEFSNIKGWLTDISVFTFILFKNKPDLKKFESKLDVLSSKSIQPEWSAVGAPNYTLKFQLEQMKDLHFSQGKLEDTPKGNKQFIYIFSVLAVVILVIALLNYINLSTAKSTERAKEVGIRKVSGADSLQLIWQFLLESFLLVFLAWIVSIVLVFFSLPFFNNLLQTRLSINQLQNGIFISLLFIVTLFLAGLYPAFVLSSFKPVVVLKGSWKHQPKGILLRKTITITQFAVAAALIVGTIVIYSQMKFIQEKDLGFNKDHILFINMPNDSASQATVNAFHNALRQRPEVLGMTISARMTEQGFALSTTTAETGDGRKKEVLCNFFQIDPQFIPLFQIHLLEGRNLSDSMSTDKNEALLVNEAFVKMMGWKSAIGKQIELGQKGRVVGVVKNFYYKSLHNMVEPLVLAYNNNPRFFNTPTIKINPEFLPIISQLFKKYFPSLPFEYEFYDDVVAKRYEKDRVSMILFKNFTLFAIFVSCLGLYGLVTLITVQRTKEIGIRKVLGATVNQLFALMTKDFMKLVFWALVIALPAAGFMMNKWLSNYAYHISLNWMVFMIPALLVLIIALLVISGEIIKTAWVNPVKSLRSE
jgi:putative ABC transport system permease protein